MDKEEHTVLFRWYPHGEAIAVFPSQVGSPCGHRCVAMVYNAQPHSVDFESVIQTTRPAVRKEYARLKKQIEQNHSYALAVVDDPKDLEEGVHENRQTRGHQYDRHPSIRALYGPRSSTLTPEQQKLV